MTYYVHRSDVSAEEGVGHASAGHAVYRLLDEENGCAAGCFTGVSMKHEDQEGFYVVEGTGWARVGDQEFRIEPDGSFMVPAQTAHTLKKDPDSEPLKVFWFHAPV